MWREQDEERFRKTEAQRMARNRRRYRWVEKTLATLSYVKMVSESAALYGGTTYSVVRADKVIGYVGLKRRESWRKVGRIRTSLIGMTRDWWSGSVPHPMGRDEVYSDYSYSRKAATGRMLEHLYDLAHVEKEEDVEVEKD